MLTIEDFIRRHTVQSLAESMPDERHEQLKQAIHNDITAYENSENKQMYSKSSYAIKKATLSDNKIRRRFNININSADPIHVISVIRTALRNFVMKCVKYSNLVLLPELGGQHHRLHFHGYYHGDLIHIDRIVKWWRRNIGYCDYKVMTGDFTNWLNYIKPIHRPIEIYKKV